MRQFAWPLLLGIAVPLAAQIPGRDPISATVVEVSARRARIAFPVDTSGNWGWSARGEHGSWLGYRWGVSVAGVAGPGAVGVEVLRRDTVARRFSSLAQLIRTAWPSVCLGGPLDGCRRGAFGVGVSDDRIVITVNDRSLIHRLFGMRPAFVYVYRSAPDDATEAGDSVAVRYVPPEIPAPGPEERSASAAAWRRYKARTSSIDRYIWHPEGNWRPIWLAVGDSLRMSVTEYWCGFDFCSDAFGVIGDSGWSVDDSAIVALRATCHVPPTVDERLMGPVCLYAFARREGETTIRVRGLHGSSDTMPSQHPPARALATTVVVGAPVVRIEITPRPDTVHQGDSVALRVRALDVEGRVVPRAPTSLTVRRHESPQASGAETPVIVRFDSIGVDRVVAGFRGLADTLVVTVVGRRRR